MMIAHTRWIFQALVLAWLLAVPLDAADPVRFTVAAEAHPVLIRRDHNPLVEVRVEAAEDGMRLRNLAFSMAGTDDFSDLELVEVLAPASSGSFPTVARFGGPMPAARSVSFSGDHPLSRGLNVFWLSCRVREAAVLTRRVAATCTGLATTAGEVAADPPVPGRRRRIGVALRRQYDDGVHTHRIPVLATTAKGTLLAAYDLRRREARDLQGDIDIGLSRSTDGGQRWESPRVIMDMGEYGYVQPEENGCSDPGLVVDRETGEVFCFAVWMHGKPGEHQWTGTGSEPGFEIGKSAQFMMVRSKDDGVTWSQPENLTRRLKREAWWLLAPSPQQGIQLADGTLVMPVQGRDETGVPFATIMTSPDHGATWSVGTPARGEASECQAAELSDGSIMLNMRNDIARHRAVAVTRDRGRTWEPHPEAERALIEPNCNASLLSVRHLDEGQDRHALVFANPRSTAARTHQTVQVSFDDGRTWPATHHLLLDEGKGWGYSSLTRIDADHVGIVYEGSQAQLVFEKFTLAELGIPVATRRWAHPRELRAKKLIDAGIYTLDSSPVPLNSRTLAEQPDFTSRHPFDGLAVRAALKFPPEAEGGPSPAGSPEAEARGECCLDSFAWAKWPVPDAAVEEAIADFRRVAWGSLTDNFLWWNCRGGSDALKGDLRRDDDWAGIRGNARLAARVCREAGLKGFLFDTEQYGRYEGTDQPYPFGAGTPELLRRRGRDWIEAVQSEFPGVAVMVTFAWSPDLPAAGFLAGVQPFLDGLLDGLVSPGRIIHGYENTFYYGQRGGSRFTETGFPGGRPRYAEARQSMRSWRSFSGAPEKFDSMVEIGMAAWLESDPWNLWGGYPSGTRETVWSNVPLALAYADEYVWCWSEHTNYLHSAMQPEERSGLNPFLASLTNQTFNTGREAVVSLEEDFSENPMARGWYFDFDMLDAGRRVRPDHAVPVLAPDSMWARWSAADGCLRIGGVAAMVPVREDAVPAGEQRRRFVHPLRPMPGSGGFSGDVEFRIDDFGGAGAGGLMLGLFHSDRPAEGHAFAVLVGEAGVVSWVLPSGWEAETGHPLPPLRSGVGYRASLVYEAPSKRLRGSVREAASGHEVATLEAGASADGADFSLDEIGVARAESGDAESGGPEIPTGVVRRVRVKAE